LLFAKTAKHGANRISNILDQLNSFVSCKSRKCSWNYLLILNTFDTIVQFFLTVIQILCLPFDIAGVNWDYIPTGIADRLCLFEYLKLIATIVR
jgi:hypothetical protein